MAKEKLEGAKVFAHLLAKSAQAMGQASEQMSQRPDRFVESTPTLVEVDAGRLIVAAVRTWTDAGQDPSVGKRRES